MSETFTKDQIHGQPAISDSEIEKVERALIDQSAKTPVLFLYSSAILWLLAATALGFLAAIEMEWPEYLGGVSFLSYGKVWPAFLSALTYGWASQVGMGTAIWLFARLTHVALRRPTWLIFGTVFWNIGVSIGVVSILLGCGQGIQWLEFPGYVQAILFIAFSLIAAWGVTMFRLRRPGHVYITLWYLLGAFLWFAWLYSAANLMINVMHVRGVVQAAVGAWYAAGFINLWLTSMGLGAIYYFIPKVSGRPVHSYHLASVGFWSFALLAGWTGMTHLIGGPLPAWLITMSIVATILMLIPVITVTVNFVLTMRGNYGLIYLSPTIRFVFFGAVVYAIAGALAVISSLRGVASITQFTDFSIGHSQLLLYGFFSMVMFGSIYYVVPRLVGCEWLSSRMIGIHFLGAAYGIGILTIMFLVSGLVQGAGWNSPEMPTNETVIHSVVPFFAGRLLGWGFLIVSHLIFALHYLTMLLRLGRPSGKPTLFPTHPEGGTH
jgi:cytochrome c oxidase cbb3-type subunit 1